MLKALQDRFGGWASDEIVPIFANYTATIFKAFGDRVTHWTSINEPKTFCWEGYGTGNQAPGILDPVWHLNTRISCLYLCMNAFV